MKKIMITESETPRMYNNFYVTFGKIFIPWIIKHIKNFPSIIKLLIGYKKSGKLRKEWDRKGIKVPVFLIISITSKCNLRCLGCYAAATGTICNNALKKSLNIRHWQRIIKEAKELGVYGFIIAGGEPFVMSDLLKLNAENKDRLFLIFSNGTLLKKQDYENLKKLRNTAIIISIEGDRDLTDSRRGKGVYEKVIRSIQNLNKHGIINGISVTITKNNFRFWMNERNLDNLIMKGVRLGFFMEYIPVDNNTELMLTTEESKKFRKQILYYRKNKKILLIHSPGDEEYAGGCISAGRGFAHITPSGDLTPCPVSNIATHNLTKSSLREGLKSPLFKIIRDNENLLEPNGSPCALFSHQKEVDELVKAVNAYRTSN